MKLKQLREESIKRPNTAQKWCFENATETWSTRCNKNRSRDDLFRIKRLTCLQRPWHSIKEANALHSPSKTLNGALTVAVVASLQNTTRTQHVAKQCKTRAVIYQRQDYETHRDSSNLMTFFVLTLGRASPLCKARSARLGIMLYFVKSCRVRRFVLTAAS